MEVLVLVSVLCPAGWAGSPVTVAQGQGESRTWGTGMRALRGSTMPSREEGILALSMGSTKLQQC